MQNQGKRVQEFCLFSHHDYFDAIFFFNLDGNGKYPFSRRAGAAFALLVPEVQDAPSRSPRFNHDGLLAVFSHLRLDTLHPVLESVISSRSPSSFSGEWDVVRMGVACAGAWNSISLLPAPHPHSGLASFCSCGVTA